MMKYVMFKAGPLHVPIIFPKYLDHDKVAYEMMDVIDGQMGTPSIVGAGFVNMATSECSGRSETLNIDSRPQDTRIVRAGGGI